MQSLQCPGCVLTLENYKSLKSHLECLNVEGFLDGAQGASRLD